jgi:RES domain
MSQTIWTRCGGLSNTCAVSAKVWRVVEDQFQNSTLKLVDTVQEQNVLEEILDELAKPPQPTDPEFDGLHFLLSTPFRYPPFHGGSRFASRPERGLWYGALEVTTALVEKAYYRFVFLLGTAAELGTVEQPWSSFSVTARSKRAVDLTAAPFLSYQSQISSPTSYAFSQPLGRAMRQDGVALCKFTSARDQAKGVNVALFAPAFDSGQVAESTHVGWMSRSTRQVVQIYRKNFARPPKTVLEYPRQYFEVDGGFPAPALSR